MDSLARETVALLNTLLPGFLAAWVFYALTSYSKPDKFERVIQALIFSLFTQPVSYLIQWLLLAIGRKWWSIVPWSTTSELIVAAFSGLVVGLGFSYFANNDKVHKLLRDLGITRESSYPSEWFAAFLNITYVVLHLRDERRIYGWPLEWPSEPGKGHFLLKQSSWLEGNTEIPIVGVDTVLVCADDVRIVEFMERTWQT